MNKPCPERIQQAKDGEGGPALLNTQQSTLNTQLQPLAPPPPPDDSSCRAVASAKADLSSVALAKEDQHPALRNFSEGGSTLNSQPPSPPPPLLNTQHSALNTQLPPSAPPKPNDSQLSTLNSQLSSVTILHIDDDPNDSALLKAAAAKAGVKFRIQSTVDGDDAVAYLSGKGRYADRAQFGTPRLLLLDMKMPRATGVDVLQWIRSQPELKDVPVVVLSGSDMKEDIKRALGAGANCYIVKPLGFDALVKVVKEIEQRWLPPR